MSRRLFAAVAASALAVAPLALVSTTASAVSSAPGWQLGAYAPYQGSLKGVALADGRFLGVAQFGGVEVYDPAADTFRSVGTVPSEALPVGLGDGRVLVVGGYPAGAASPTTAARIYDPATSTWSATASAPVSAVASNPATTLADGRAMVATATWTPAGVTSHAYVYSPVAGAWSDAGAPRSAGTLTVLADGSVLAVGAMNGAATADVYNPATNAWTAVAAPAVFRGGQTATRLKDGRVLVAGGEQPTVPAVSEVFDPATRTWSKTGAMNVGRFLHQAVLLDDGRVLAISGDSYYSSWEPTAELWDPATGRWSFASPVNLGRTYFAAFALPGDRALLFGGPYAQAEVYNGEDPALPRVDSITPSVPRVLDTDTAALAATADDAAGGVSAAEYFLDDDPGVGNGHALTVTPTGATTADLAGVLGPDLPDGRHRVNVRVADGSGTWSRAQSVWFEVYPDPSIPQVTDPWVSPNPKRDTQTAQLQASAKDDVAVVGAEYFLGDDPGQGHGIPMSVTPLCCGQAVITAWLGTDIPAGTYQLGLRAVDGDGHWGKTVYLPFSVWSDSTPPQLSGVTVSPNPAKVGQEVTLSASAYDERGLAVAEYFIGDDPGVGRGLPLFGGSPWGQNFTLSAPLGGNLAAGVYRIGVRAEDTSGNWSTPVFVTLEVYTDVTPPMVANVAVSPDLAREGDAVGLSAALSDDHGLARAEYYVDADPGVGRATPLAVPYGSLTAGAATSVSGLAPGEHVIGVRALDVNGNWSAATTASVIVYDPAAGSISAGGNIDAVNASDAGKAKVSFDAAYATPDAIVPTGSLEIHTDTVALHGLGFAWMLTDGSTVHLLGTARAQNGTGVWTVRVDATVGSKAPMRVRLFAPGVDPAVGNPAVTLDGPLTGSVSWSPTTA